MNGETMIETPELLYHYTSFWHTKSILEYGYILRTDSMLHNVEYNKNRVVWLTTSLDPDGHGLEGASLDKKEIRITISSRNCKKWLIWSRRKKIDLDWAALLETAFKAECWWISTRDISIDRIWKIENLKTGRVYFDPTQNIDILNDVYLYETVDIHSNK